MADNKSFLPDDYLEKRLDRRTNIICLTLFVVVMAGVAGAYFVTDRQRTEVKALHGEVNENFRKAAERMEQLSQLQKRKTEMVRKAKITSVLIERVPRSVVMAELINNMPKSLSLTEFEMHTKAIKQPPTAKTALERAKEQAKKASLAKKTGEDDEPKLKPTEVTISLVGLAKTDVEIAQFITALNRTILFYDVNLMFSEQTKIEEEELRKFRIELKLQQDVQKEELSPRRVRRDLMQNPMANEIQITPDGVFEAPAQEPDATVAVPTGNE